jgi:hypothetical protein
MKLAGDPNNPLRAIRDDITVDELRKRTMAGPLLIQAGLDTTINHGLVRWGANGWYVINYDILRDYPEIKSGKPWDLLILDESHKLKNVEAIRTQHVFGSHAIAPIPAEKVLLLTGTPMINYVHDLYTQLHCLDPAMWPSFEHARTTGTGYPRYQPRRFLSSSAVGSILTWGAEAITSVNCRPSPVRRESNISPATRSLHHLR